MRSFLTIARFEFDKAVRLRTTWVTLALPGILAAATVAWGAMSGRIESVLDGEATLDAPSAFLIFSQGAGNGIMIGCILLLFYSSLTLAQEGHWRTFKTVAIKPHGRLTWLAGKLLLLVVMAWAIVVVATGSAWAAGAVAGDFTSIMEEGWEFYTRDEMIRFSATAVALSAASIVSFAAFGLMFSAATDHPGVASSACLGSYMVLEVAKTSVEPRHGLFLFNTFVPSLNDTSYFAVLRGYADGLSDVGWEDASTFYFNIGTPLVSALVFSVVAAVIFSRRDFVL